MFESTSSTKSLPSQPASSEHQRRSLGTRRQTTIRYVYWMQHNRSCLTLFRILFDASIACNFVSALPNPIFKILDRFGNRTTTELFLNVSSLREPRLASPWLGALIINFESHVMRTARSETSMVD